MSLVEVTATDPQSCPHCGSTDLQDTPAGTHCAECGVNVNEYEEEYEEES
jgi:DNA-directed RNA polymerase subunit RPC12/RpoP